MSILCLSQFHKAVQCGSKSHLLKRGVGLLHKESVRVKLKPIFQIAKYCTDASIVNNSQKWVGRWLMTCSGMVFGAVVLGGVTRLTESGLSMTDWHLFGKLPPFSTEDWQKEFSQYQEFPEFKMKNQEMSLQEFKLIWWMEYGHRQWGRLIGSFFLLPASFFWMKGYLSSPLKKRVVVMGGLILAQGLLGWYMVKSGLENERFPESNDVPRVSHYRLMSHLGLAFALYSIFLWNGLSQLYPAAAAEMFTPAAASFRRFGHLMNGWIVITALSGALVAGLDAGLVYNSFPKMADQWIPSDLTSSTQTIKNFTQNPTAVQFSHRILGTTTLVLASVAGIWSRRLSLPPKAQLAASSLFGMAWMQVGLGISTLVLYVPTWLAVLHQSGSLLTLTCAIWLSHELRNLRKIIKR